MEENFSTIENHIVILGWSDRVKRIISELRNEVHGGLADQKPILVVADQPETSLRIPYEKVYVIYGRINDAAVLKRANLPCAAALLIPTTLHNTSVSDGETVFTLLAALSINPKLRVCIEIAEAQNSETLERIRHQQLTQGDIEIVSFETVAERLMAQAAVNPGITEVYDHLLSFSPVSNEIYVSDLSPQWAGKSFRSLAKECFEREVILIGYQTGEELTVNPKNRDYVFLPNDRVWFIAYNKFDGLKVVNPGASAE
jgi:Trk K+ transport system NAD-binding subunit